MLDSEVHEAAQNPYRTAANRITGKKTSRIFGILKKLSMTKPIARAAARRLVHTKQAIARPRSGFGASGKRGGVPTQSLLGRGRSSRLRCSVIALTPVATAGASIVERGMSK
jgi:hypothetical protein